MTQLRVPIAEKRKLPHDIAEQETVFLLRDFTPVKSEGEGRGVGRFNLTGPVPPRKPLKY